MITVGQVFATWVVGFCCIFAMGDPDSPFFGILGAIVATLLIGLMISKFVISINIWSINSAVQEANKITP